MHELQTIFFFVLYKRRGRADT